MIGLSVTASRLGPAFDLLAAYRDGGFFFERAGVGLSTSGDAARIRAEPGPERILRLSRSVLETLTGLERDPEGPTPVAVASIPFDDGRPAEAVVPTRTAIRAAPGETWQLDVAEAGSVPVRGERGRWTGRTLPHAAFAAMQLRPDPEPDDYAAAVSRAIDRIRAGELRKIVLARTMLVNAGRTLDAKQLLWRLRAVDADCYAFAAPQPDPAVRSVLVGATPELLVRRRGRLVEAIYARWGFRGTVDLGPPQGTRLVVEELEV